MTKPYEETWTTHEYEGTLLIDARRALSYEMFPHAIQSSSPTLEETNARARLAAQAPAMARQLLELGEMLEDPAGMTITGIDESRAKIVAVLRAAGVMP